MNRKQLYLVIASFLMVGVLITASALLGGPDTDEDRTKVVATFYPLEYMAKAIGGDRVTATSLVPYNSELHSWQPSFSDIRRAGDADVILYNGGPADRWLVEDVLPSIKTTGKTVVNTTLGVTYISGGHDHDDDHDDEGSADPHTWLSPARASLQAWNVYLALCHADPDGREYFNQRFEALNATLNDLDQRYRSLSYSNSSVVIVSHAALGYVAYDYGFHQHGVIGLSADQEPTVASLTNIIGVMEEEGVYSIFVDPVYSDKYAKTLKRELEARTGQTVAVLNMFLALGPYKDLDYLEQLESNLMNLRTGLGVPA